MEERQAIYVDIQQAIDYMQTEKCEWTANTRNWENIMHSRKQNHDKLKNPSTK